MKFVLVCVIAGFMTSCSTLAVSLTPQGVKDAVVIATAVSDKSVKDTPEGVELEKYLRLNNEMWESLARFYGVMKENK